MKFNKWTMGLAAVGVVSLASAARADETKMSQVQTALSNTTLSGYVDTSAMWSLGSQNGGPTPKYTPGGVATDGFNLNAIDIALDHPEDESPWAAGYHVEMMAGPDAVPGTQVYWSPNTTHGPYTVGAPLSVRQAYLTLRTPVGNSGIDWKVGVWDTIIGYESSSDPANPNFTRSYGYSIEPTTETGILGTYKVNDMISISAGVADTGNGIDTRAAYETQKAYLGSIAFTAPDSWGWAKGATLNAGVIEADNGSANGVTANSNGTTSLYAGITTPTPLNALKVGAAFDWLDLHDQNYPQGGERSDDSVWVAGLYGSYQINDKASFNLRGEFLNDSGAGPYAYNNYQPNYGTLPQDSAEEMTATLQYNLWANVISRVEFRWDHVDHGRAFDAATNTGTTAHENAYLLALNLIYQF
jgi:hypothetical protein